MSVRSTGPTSPGNQFPPSPCFVSGRYSVLYCSHNLVEQVNGSNRMYTSKEVISWSTQMHVNRANQRSSRNLAATLREIWQIQIVSLTVCSDQMAQVCLRIQSSLKRQPTTSWKFQVRLEKNATETGTIPEKKTPYRRDTVNLSSPASIAAQQPAAALPRFFPPTIQRLAGAAP